MHAMWSTTTKKKTGDTGAPIYWCKFIITLNPFWELGLDFDISWLTVGNMSASYHEVQSLHQRCTLMLPTTGVRPHQHICAENKKKKISILIIYPFCLTILFFICYHTYIHTYVFYCLKDLQLGSTLGLGQKNYVGVRNHVGRKWDRSKEGDESVQQRAMPKST
jgi:hypothetical protein